MEKVLVIGLVWPEPVSSAAGWRMLHLVELLSTSYEVHFASAASKSEYSYDMTDIAVQEHHILLNDASFDDVVKEINPSVVVFDRFMTEEQYGWRIARQCPQALRVLDTEDLHFLRFARQESFKTKAILNLKNEVSKREIASILRSDLSLIISETEMNILKDKFNVPPSLLFYLPFQEKYPVLETLGESFEHRKDFIFIGNFLHDPNWRTVEILKKDIWPELRRKLPKAELHVYGAYPTEKVWQLHKPKEGFHIKGRAHEARKTIARYRVLLAPIPFGAGTKGKFVDAMLSGTPSITSTVGAEGMLDPMQWSGFVADDNEKFVDKACLLYQNRQIWESKQQIGYDAFNALFADNSYSANFLFRLKDLAEMVNEHRDENFIGQILLHHSMQSTKYMSLWIEAKNAKG